MHGSHRAGRPAGLLRASSARLVPLFLPVAVLLSPPATGASSASLFDGFRPPVGQQPNSITLADLNADGKLDLVVGNCGSQDVSVLLGNGDGTFAPQVRYPAGGCPGQIVILDFTSDGKPDLAVVVGGNIVILAGNGAGGFAPASTAIPGAGASWPLIGGDFNGDGKKDLASVGGAPQANLLVFMGNGNGTFQTAAEYATAGKYSLVAADFNGDGRTDFATFDGGGNVSVHLGNLDGSFTMTDSKAVAPLPPLDIFVEPSLVAGNLNGDSNPDLVVYDSDGPQILAGRGDGTFGDPAPFLEGGSTFPFVGDLDGDGRDDFVTVGGMYLGSNQVGVDIYLQGAGGSFEHLATRAAGSSSAGVALGDINGDGMRDLAVINPGANDISILLAPAYGGPGPLFHTPAPAGIFDLTAADLRRDGRPDLLAGNGGAIDGFEEYLGKGAGQFDAYNFGPVGACLYPSSMAVADLDGDGNQDTVFTGFSSCATVAYLGTGDGFYDPSPHYIFMGTSGPLLAADLDRDGHPDVVVPYQGMLLVYAGTGGGNFTLSTNFGTGFSPFALVSGDLNGDGTPDIIAAGSGIQVFLGDGDLTFTPGSVVTLPDYAWSVAVADLDGDSRPEILAPLMDGEVAVLKADGSGGYAVTLYPAGKSLRRIAVADFNGDEMTDVAVTDSGEHALEILLGNGDGTLQAPLRFQSGFTPWGLAAADFDSDGRVDLAVGIADPDPSAYPSSNEMVIYLNHGPFPPCHDADGDGYGSPANLTCPAGGGLDCDDSNAAIHPGQAEICDGRDNNCDGKVDEGFPDTDGDGVADCVDNCASIWNPGQADSNGNGVGDVCEEAALFAAANLSTADFSANRVDGRDLGIFAGAFGTCPGDTGFDAAANLDRVPDTAGPPGSCVGSADFHLFMEEFAKVH